jgi:hypothetical protein
MNGWFAFSIIPLHALIENSIFFCNYALFRMSGQFDDVTRSILVVVVVRHVFFWSRFLEGAGIFHKQRSKDSY